MISLPKPATRWPLHLLWRLIAPLSVTWLALYMLIPTRAEAPAQGWFGRAVGLLERFDVVVAVGMFIIVKLLINYWRLHLPGGHVLERAPAEGPTPPGRRQWRNLSFSVAMVCVIACSFFIRTWLIE